MSATENLNPAQFVGRKVKFKDTANGKGVSLEGTVESYTPASNPKRYDRFVVKHADGTRYTRDSSTVRFVD